MPLRAPLLGAAASCCWKPEKVHQPPTRRAQLRPRHSQSRQRLGGSKSTAPPSRRSSGAANFNGPEESSFHSQPNLVHPAALLPHQQLSPSLSWRPLARRAPFKAPPLRALPRGPARRQQVGGQLEVRVKLLVGPRAERIHSEAPPVGQRGGSDGNNKCLQLARGPQTMLTPDRAANSSPQVSSAKTNVQGAESAKQEKARRQD